MQAVVVQGVGGQLRVRAAADGGAKAGGRVVGSARECSLDAGRGVQFFPDVVGRAPLAVLIDHADIHDAFRVAGPEVLVRLVVLIAPQQRTDDPVVAGELGHLGAHGPDTHAV